MKKIILSVLLLSFLFLCSCGGGASMKELLKYQSGDFKAGVSISDGGEFEAVIKKEGETYSVTIVAPAETAGLSYVSEDGQLYLCYEEIKIPVSASAPFSASEWVAAFRLEPSDGWKITSESPGGANVYKCVTENAAVYIDRVTHSPYRIEYRGAFIDISSFEVIKQSSAE